jgi:OOP family OmpA-OmpF porin
MNSLAKFVGAAFAAVAIIPTSVFAQIQNENGYVTDSSGKVVLTGTGLCLHVRVPESPYEDCGFRPVAAAPAPVAPAPRPAVIAPAPPVAPRVIVAQAPVAQPAPVPRKISFSADALFAFDKAELKPEGKVMLGDLARQLNSTNYDVIHATGHTDRFGSTAYNQKLSDRRAASVKDYLVTQNIPANRITTAGMGESQPMTKANECLGPKSVKVVACLQPDRRVDVDINMPVANR